MSRINPESHIILWTARNGDTYANDGHGRNELVYRNAKIGATIIDRKKFDAAVAENNPPLESWPAFLAGLTVGAATAFTVTAIIGYCVWRVA